MVPVILTKREMVIGFLMVIPVPKHALRPQTDISLNPRLDLLDVAVNPSPFDLSKIFDLPLRFDVNIYSKVEFQKHQNTVSFCKIKLNEYLTNARRAKSAIESMFVKSIISFNSFGPIKIGEFKIALKGFFRNSLGNRNEIVLFSNQESSTAVDITQIYERVCFGLVENFPAENFCNAQSNFFEFHNLSIINTLPLNEEEVLSGKQSDRKSMKVETTQQTCNNYGCSAVYDIKENIEKCLGHHGTWDFGHTGTSLELSLQQSAQLLWNPHWTCCGRSWSEQCSNFHFHENRKNRAAIDLEDPFNQKRFKKNIRTNWLQRIKALGTPDESGLRKKISKFAEKTVGKAGVGL